MSGAVARQTAPRDSSGRISFPRQTKPRPRQPPIQSRGKRMSRRIKAASDRRLKCHPAARASAASAPYHAAATARTLPNGSPQRRNDVGRGGEGGEAAGQNLQRVILPERGLPQLRPAQLTRPYFAGGAVAEGLLERRVDQANA